MERVGDRQGKMEGYCSTGQSPQWAVVPMEEAEEVHKHFLSQEVLHKSQQEEIIEDSSILGCDSVSLCEYFPICVHACVCECVSACAQGTGTCELRFSNKHIIE